VKRLTAALAILVVALATVSGGHRAFAGTGNGAPSGTHYDLNIHGTTGHVSNPGGNNGHDIFMPLVSDKSGTEPSCDIMLQQGPYGTSIVNSFQVIYPTCNNPGATAAGYPSAYATNAVFELPCPVAVTTSGCPSSTTGYTTLYSVWARQVGHFGSANATTCYTDATGATYCNLGTVTFTKKTFQNVTAGLLFVCQGTTSGGVTTYQNVPIFNNTNYQYWWDYDNNGARLVQLRFYQTQTMVSSACSGNGAP
jgi:hypothetical protein